MMNWAGFAFKSAKTDAKLGSDILKTTASYLESKTNQMQLEMQAKNYGKAAEDFNRKAGRVQEQGRMARESRLIQAGQDVGHITASAAGSGIDVSSNTVKKTISDTMVAAYNDVSVMAKNEAEASRDMQNRALEAKVSQIWTEYNIDMEKANRKAALIGGVMSAASNFAGGMADASNSLMM